MGYWTIWVGSLIGVLLGVAAFGFVTRELKWPPIVAVSITILIIFAFYWIFYFIEYGHMPNLDGLTGLISGVWGEIVGTFRNFSRAASSALH